ncbi:MAG: hypothetical protein IJ880_05440 [Bacilli bacterium]|nr:hypothetical protein [Bacilli bacterium]
MENVKDFKDVIIIEEKGTKVTSFEKDNKLYIKVPKKQNYKQYMKILKKIIF